MPSPEQALYARRYRPTRRPPSRHQGVPSLPRLRTREQFVEDYLVDADEAPDAYAVKISRTEEKVDELRGTVEDLERTVEKQGDEIEQLRKDREDAFDTFLDRLEEKLNGEYREMLREDIVDELNCE